MLQSRFRQFFLPTGHDAIALEDSSITVNGHPMQTIWVLDTTTASYHSRKQRFASIRAVQRFSPAFLLFGWRCYLSATANPAYRRVSPTQPINL